MRKVIFIGGAPCTGKTELAKLLSKKYSCPWISTDLIRSWMKEIVDRDRYSGLFNFDNVSAEEHYKEKSVEETIRLEQERDKEVFRGVKKFVERNRFWDFYIIEGISILPKFVADLKMSGVRICKIFLYEGSRERIRDILQTRGLWGKEDWVKQVECEYVAKTNEYYLEECERYGLQWFLIPDDRDQLEEEIIEYIGTRLKL